MEFILNENEDDHKKFIENINSLYNILSEIIEKNNIFVLQINRPIYGNNKNKSFYVNIAKKTYIENIQNHEKMEIEDINCKRFYSYPFLCNPILNLSNNILYLNFYLYSIFIKINIDYKKIKTIMKIKE